ncbi:MAG: beta-ketoacyl-ACP synthase II [Clostridiales bacterium]|nr:beta-ketoacyl-ACP synthase II [Clostridiales bacterium]
MKRVVVTGMGAVTPVGNTTGEYWEALVRGVNGIAKIESFDVSGFKHTLAAQLKDFDPTQFIDKLTARKTDPFVQYALCAAQQAVDDSGILEKIDHEEFGVYFGSGIGGFETFCNEHQALLEQGPRKVTPQFVSKMIYNIAAGNIAIRFKAYGPNIAVSTACATGTTAVGEAYRAIRGGYATAIIAGGSEAAIAPLTLAGFGNCLALTPSSDPNAASLPFDKRRGGFVMGEGAGALVLEEYEHAVNRGATIYAEVCGYGSTCDAHHVTAPDPDAAHSARAIAQALKESGEFEASKIYINAHGTGTALNDKTETHAFKKVFGDAAYQLHISSTKSMTGHLLGAAGAIEAIAAVKALQTGVIPPTINLNEPDEDCDLNYTPNTAVTAAPELALSTSLGFGGHNACIAFKKV